MAYLVTGATGFLGKHLLERLLARGERVYCLVRAASQSRLHERAQQRYGAAAERVLPVIGDITLPACGLSEAELDALRGTIGELFHLAASYDLAADRATAERGNVLGTRQVVDLANRLGCRLHHVSSIAVAGNHVGKFDESMFAQGQSFEHPYFSTKYAAEEHVRSACKTPYRIYRPAIVIGSSQTGEADKVDGPYYAFKLIQRLRFYVPQWFPLLGLEGSRLWLAPVDYVADALDCLAHLPGLDGRAFHLVDANSPYLGTALNEFCKAAHAPRFSPRFDRRITALIPTGPLRTLFALPPVREFVRQTLDDLGIPESVLELDGLRLKFVSAETDALLHAHGVRCPALSSYAWRVWDYWERHMDPDLKRVQTVAEVLRGKCVLVTGASSGIGRAIALKVAQAGAVPILVARSFDKLAEVKGEIEQAGGQAHLCAADLSTQQGCDDLLASLAAQALNVDVLINNAGRSIRRAVDHSYDRLHDYERTMALNYFGALRLIMGLLPSMRARKSGHIINVSSEGVQVNAPKFSAYVASKAALDAFSRVTAAEVLADHVHFTTVYMPLVRTPMISPTKIYSVFPALSPEKAAEIVLSAVIHRPKDISTRVGKWVSLAYSMSPKLVDRAFNIGERLLPDRDEKEGASAAPGSLSSLALAQLVKGVHW